ncbi:MAG TPA: GNAT family N-acetyltransferase, partial [Herpetosiphonaceae bacterium]
MAIVPYQTAWRERFAPLFAQDPPVALRLWAMLDGAIPGRLATDSIAAPSYALLQERADGTAYVGGDPAPAALRAALRELAAVQAPVICLRPGDPLLAALPGNPGYQGEAVDWTDRSPLIDLAPLAERPTGYELRRIDAELAPALAGFGYYAEMFGGLEAALAGTVGYCLLDGAAPVSEAVAGPFARGVAELGVGTDEGYRGRGLGLVVAAAA